MKIEAIIIDGVADLVNDTNDTRESKELISELLRYAQEYQCAIIAVIHINHGSESKATGHLGSQLEKKAEAVVMLQKDGEIVTVSVPVTRGCPISSSAGPQFFFNEELGMHVSIASKLENRVDTRDASLKTLLFDLYGNNRSDHKSRMDIKAAVMDKLKLKTDAAEKIVKQMTGNQWLVSGYGRGHWMLSKKLQSELAEKNQQLQGFEAPEG